MPYQNIHDDPGGVSLVMISPSSIESIGRTVHKEY